MLPRDSEADVETEMSYRAHKKLIMHTAFNSPNDDFCETSNGRLISNQSLLCKPQREGGAMDRRFEMRYLLVVGFLHIVMSYLSNSG
jgi:hypothetical protein